MARQRGLDAAAGVGAVAHLRSRAACSRLAVTRDGAQAPRRAARAGARAGPAPWARRPGRRRPYFTCRGAAPGGWGRGTQGAGRSPEQSQCLAEGNSPASHRRPASQRSRTTNGQLATAACLARAQQVLMSTGLPHWPPCTRKRWQIRHQPLQQRAVCAPRGLRRPPAARRSAAAGSTRPRCATACSSCCAVRSAPARASARLWSPPAVCSLPSTHPCIQLRGWRSQLGSAPKLAALHKLATVFCKV